MKQATIFGIIGLALLVGAVSVFAHGADSVSQGWNGVGHMMMFGNYDEYDNMHEDMENVLESGSYEDLVQLREEYDMPMMYWVENEEDFQLAQQMHERFDKEEYSMPCGMR